MSQLLNLRSWVKDSLCGLWLEKRLNDERWLLLKSAASRSVFASENIQPPDAGRFASETRDFRAPVKVRLARALTLGLRIPMVLERQNSQRPLDRRPPKSAFARGNNLHQPASRHPPSSPPNTRPRSRGVVRPSSAVTSARQRAWGMPGAYCTRSLACEMVVSTRASSPWVQPDSPDIPARNGFNGFLRALPGDRAFLSPSSSG
jgi:hypothetical protein